MQGAKKGIIKHFDFILLSDITIYLTGETILDSSITLVPVAMMFIQPKFLFTKFNYDNNHMQ